MSDQNEHDKGCPATASLFTASLIPQPWMQSKDDVPASRCYCRKFYVRWSDGKVLRSKATASEGAVT